MNIKKQDGVRQLSSKSEAKNLKVISEGIDAHNNNCEFPAVKVLMNPFEVERLDWDTIKGLPVEPSDTISTGRFRIVCANEIDNANSEEITEAIGTQVETGDKVLMPV